MKRSKMQFIDSLLGYLRLVVEWNHDIQAGHLFDILFQEDWSKDSPLSTILYVQ